MSLIRSPTSGPLRLCRHSHLSLVIIILYHQGLDDACRLLAYATVANTRGLPASHDSVTAPHLYACVTTTVLLMISRRRSVRSPIFEMARSFCLPPVEISRAVKPNHAAKSLSHLRVSAGRADAEMAVAALRPAPGMVINLRAT